MTYDVVVIGAGASGEAAGGEAASLGAKVLVVEKELVGGECAFWACMPSKTLLDSAARRAAGAGYPWKRASNRRDWMISRENIDFPDDSGHVSRLEKAGAEVARGVARITGSGKLEIAADGRPPRKVEAANLILCSGSTPIVPTLDGLAEAGYWTNREATSARRQPDSLVILGAGPMGVETAQFYARFGTKVTLIDGHDRILPRDHPRNSCAVEHQLRKEGVDIRLNVRAAGVAAGPVGRTVALSDGSTASGEELVIAVGRKASLAGLGAGEAGVRLNDAGAAEADEQMRVADGVFVAGDAAGGLQFTHLADYEGRVAARAALGHPARADLGSVPKATYTDPETAAVGLSLDEALQQGVDAFEEVADFAETSRGYTIEDAHGHLTAVIDRRKKLLIGAFAACRGASELIHEAVLAIKAQIPLSVLADTMHAFPTAARGFGNLLAEANKKLG
ncbi:MAG: dihydrolipoyl dehydrogenase family protein [Actinomycetota bacterium]